MHRKWRSLYAALIKGEENEDRYYNSLISSFSLRSDGFGKL